MRYGRSSDRLFEMFIRAKLDNDVDQARDVLAILDTLPDIEQEKMSDLRADIDDYINDMEDEYEYAYA